MRMVTAGVKLKAQRVLYSYNYLIEISPKYIKKKMNHDLLSLRTVLPQVSF